MIWHYCDVIMGVMASQITNLTIVYSTIYSGTDQRKHQSSASLAFVREIHRGPVNSPHKWPVTWKMFLFDDVIMGWGWGCKWGWMLLAVQTWIELTKFCMYTSWATEHSEKCWPACNCEKNKKGVLTHLKMLTLSNVCHPVTVTRSGCC